MYLCELSERDFDLIDISKLICRQEIAVDLFTVDIH